MRSVAFRNVALGALALVAAYELGARTARGQVGQQFEGANAWIGSVAVNRVVYSGAGGHPLALGPPVPGQAPILATYSGVGGPPYVITADGKWLYWSGVGDWQVLADFSTVGATAAQHATFGQIKAKYAH